MDLKTTIKQAIILSAVALFLLALVPSEAWAGEKSSAPGAPYFGEVKVVGPTKGQGSLSIPSKVPASQTPKAPLSIPKPKGPMLPSPGLPKSQAALPAAPKHYKLEPEAGAVKFGDGQRGARLPSGDEKSSTWLRTGQTALGGSMVLPAPPVKGPGALGSLPLPPPQGVSPADPTSPPLPGGASERGIIVQTAPGASPAGDTVPTENLSLNYDEVKPSYTPQSSGKSKGNVGTDWKVEEGEK